MNWNCAIFRFSVLTECWAENAKERPSFQWICTAVKRLTKDQKVERPDTITKEKIIRVIFVK